ncbi:MAG: hypothetical protein H6747_02820, partial [Deltaproteobacteria bacterium]|nr:hypothetical protein [Deltaproteobacteria bacterium]
MARSTARAWLVTVLALTTAVVALHPDVARAVDRTEAPLRIGQAGLERRAADRRRPAGRRGESAEIDAETMPIWRRPHPRIATHVRGSIAIGTVTEGFLVAPAE